MSHSGRWSGSLHDIQMLRHSGILDTLKHNEALLGDKYYQGEL
jgi:hypothetical protein